MFLYLGFVRERKRVIYIIVCVYTQNAPHISGHAAQGEMSSRCSLHNTQLGAASAQVIIENTQRKLSKLQSMT
jgi:hypothetical protein